jgi:hypothetical protein
MVGVMVVVVVVVVVAVAVRLYALPLSSFALSRPKAV